jgi:hypothetical protein
MAAKQLEDELGPDVVVDVLLVDEIPRTQSGKQPSVVSNVSQDGN